MRKKYFVFFIIVFIFVYNNSYSNIEERIVAKIGNNIITKYDIMNEVNTILALSNKQANQNELSYLQNIAFNKLKKKLIKENEIIKYKITKYNKGDLNNYILKLENNMGVKNIGLEKHFEKYKANYEEFIKSVIINLKWNTLIYSLYQKQLDVDKDLIKSEISNQLKKERKIIEYNLSEIVIENYDDNKLNKVIENIKNNGFEKTATLFSDSISSSQGGSIGWIESKSISSAYLNEISNLKVNQISNPIKMNNNIVIIKLNDKRTFNKNDIDLDAIEKNIVNKRKEEKLNIFSNSHLLDLEKKTYVEINE